MAVSFLIAKCVPFMLRYIGSEKGATCTSSTALPGKQPISRSFNGMFIEETSVIMAFSPRLRCAKVTCKLI